MGVREYYHKKYHLYQSDGWLMLSVIQLSEDCFELADLGGMKKSDFKPHVTKAELEKIKRKHKLYRKEELGTQMRLF